MKITPKAIGKMSCLCCGEQITVKQADTGTVSVSCPDCDFSGYGKAGTDAHRHILGRVVRRTAAEPTPAAPAPATKPPAARAATTAPKAPPAPTPATTARRNTVFG